MDGALAEWEDDDEWEGDDQWCIIGYDGEVIAAESLHVKPAAVHGGAAQPVRSGGGGGGGGMAAYEDDDYKTFLLPGPETIVGCDHGGEATVVPSTPSHSAGAPTSSSSSSPSPSPPLSPRAASPAPEEALPGRPDDLVGQAGVAKHDAEPAAKKGNGAVAGRPRPAGSHRRGVDDAWEDDNDEATDDDDDRDDGGLYEAYYDLADHGRARRVKRSRGRRATPKKMGLIGRPRCEDRTSRVAINF